MRVEVLAAPQVFTSIDRRFAVGFIEPSASEPWLSCVAVCRVSCVAPGLRSACTMPSLTAASSMFSRRARNKTAPEPGGDGGSGRVRATGEQLTPREAAEPSKLPPKIKEPLAPLRVFEVERVAMKIKSIDVISQLFSARCFIELRVRNVQGDTAFMAKDDDGKLINTMTKSSEPGRKVVPSVMWYLENQIHWPNSWECNVEECKAIPAKGSKEDIVCTLRVEGTFQEEMELFNFPLDYQDLHLLFEIQCADRSSPFPVQLIKSPDIAMVNDNESFNLRNVWSLHPVMTATSFHNKGIAQAGGFPTSIPHSPCRAASTGSTFITSTTLSCRWPSSPLFLFWPTSRSTSTLRRIV